MCISGTASPVRIYNNTAIEQVIIPIKIRKPFTLQLLKKVRILQLITFISHMRLSQSVDLCCCILFPNIANTMNSIKYKILLFVLVTTSVSMFYACSKSTSNNPVNNTNTVAAFTFVVGTKLQFTQMSLDTNNKEITGSFRFIHETFVDSNFTIGGQSKVYVAIDSIYDTLNTFQPPVDSVFYFTSGDTVSIYGFFANVIGSLSGVAGSSNITPKWNVVVDQGSTGWAADTTTVQNLPGVPLQGKISEMATGKDIGSAQIAVLGNPITTDHSRLTSYLSNNGAVLDTVYIDEYMSSNPAIPIKTAWAAQKISFPPFPTIQLNGYERTLVAF